MSSVFTRIINGELPSHTVWEDATCVAFLSIAPVAPGHTLVVPRVEVDKWIELDPAVWLHLNKVAQTIGKAIKHAFNSERVGSLIAGFEVPHTHIHLFPANDMSGFNLSTADSSVEQSELAAAADKIRDALVEVVQK